MDNLKLVTIAVIFTLLDFFFNHLVRGVIGGLLYDVIVPESADILFIQHNWHQAVTDIIAIIIELGVVAIVAFVLFKSYEREEMLDERQTQGYWLIILFSTNLIMMAVVAFTFSWWREFGSIDFVTTDMLISVAEYTGFFELVYNLIVDTERDPWSPTAVAAIMVTALLRTIRMILFLIGVITIFNNSTIKNVETYPENKPEK